MTCQELETRYFGIGGYNSNVILKYLMVIHDPQSKLKWCINIKNKHAIWLRGIPNQTISKHLIDLELKWPKFLKTHAEEYLNPDMIDFLLQIDDRQIVIKNDSNLYYSLERLDELGHLNVNFINKFFKFSNSKKNKKEIFKGLLEEFKAERLKISLRLKEFSIIVDFFKGQIEKCNQFLKLFDEANDNEIKLIN